MPSRRLILFLPALAALPRPLWAAVAFARVMAASGEGKAILPSGEVVPLARGLDLPEGARVETFADGLVELAMTDGTRLYSGRDTSVLLQARGQADSRAALTVMGVLVIDRRTVASGQPMKVTGEGFDVELAGAQVFIESLRNEARQDALGAVFVKEGGARVAAPLGDVLLAAGEGIDILPMPALVIAPEVAPDRGSPGAILDEEAPAGVPPLPAPPQDVGRWSDDRVRDAFASVGLTT